MVRGAGGSTVKGQLVSLPLQQGGHPEYYRSKSVRSYHDEQPKHTRNGRGLYSWSPNPPISWHWSLFKTRWSDSTTGPSDWSLLRAILGQGIVDAHDIACLWSSCWLHRILALWCNGPSQGWWLGQGHCKMDPMTSHGGGIC